MDTKNVFVVFAFLILFAVSEAGNFFNIGNNRYYISHPLRKSWFESFQYCKFHCLVLVDINNEAENNQILSIIKSPAYVNDATPHYWTSGTDLGSEGQFYWASTGHSVTFSDYADNAQPDNAGGEENCLEFRGEFDFKWNDHGCHEKKYFICRNPVWLPIPDNEKLTLVVNASAGYTYVSLL